MLIPSPEPLEEFFPALARMVARTSWLPHPETVRALNRAAFPTSRARKLHPRFSLISEDGETVGMYDDNATPSWTALWAHGIIGGNRNGWGFGHVWPASDYINRYTHLANLAMIPECFGSLTHKEGPCRITCGGMRGRLTVGSRNMWGSPRSRRITTESGGGICRNFVIRCVSLASGLLTLITTGCVLCVRSWNGAA
jgi:hypothetical protein